MTRPTILTAALAALLLAAPALAQQTPTAPPGATGRVVGRVLEESTGAPVPGAQVGVSSGGSPTTASIDGRYVLLDVPAGPVALTVRAIGYSPKTVSGVFVPAGGVAVQDITIAAASVVLGEITVSAAAERGSVAAALAEQRDAPGIVNAVTAEQIARSPDSDAGQAVQRVSGVTVQDGRYVLVRGLGERYTTTSLNSARLPSPEPDRKVVPLDLFPSSLLEAVQTSKTFTPDQPGDFSGAQVNLRTREFFAGRVLSWSFASTVNTAATLRSLPVAPSVGSEWAGFAGRSRTLPLPIAAAPASLSGVDPAAMPGLIGSFRNVWTADQVRAAPSGSASFSVGGEDPVFGRLVGYLVSLTYAASTDARRGEQRALALADGSGGTRAENEYAGQSVTSAVLWGGILNLTTRLGSTAKLTFNNTYNRSGDNGVVRAAGFNEEFARYFDITRLSYVSRSVRSNQLAGEHLVGGRHQLTWAVTSSGVTRDEPDRSDLAYEAQVDTASGLVTPVAWWGGPRSGNRTFSALQESAWQGDVAWRWRLGARTAVKMGAQARTADRGADTRSYDIVNQSMSDTLRMRAPEQVFADTNDLWLVANANGGRYDATDRLWAGFGQVELPIGPRLRVLAGARLEHSDVRVDTRATDGTLSLANPVTTDLLPAVAVTWELSRTQQLRFSATQTLSRPEYREMSEVSYFEILGGVSVRGNSGLRRALIQNLDARWEFYPSGGEVVSVGLFAKHFDNPIERILVGTTGAETATFVNTDGASNYGVEIEVRRNLGFLSPALLPFTAFANATLMHSRITTGNDTISSLTNNARPMVGQSPYVVNAGIGYTSASGRFSGTALFNVTGRRITEVGVQPRPDTYEEARHLLDLALRYQVTRGFSLKLDAKNLLDAPYRTTQGAVTRHRYTVGRAFSVGIGWEP